MKAKLTTQEIEILTLFTFRLDVERNCFQAKGNRCFAQVVFWGLSTRLFTTGYALRMRQAYAYAANESIRGICLAGTCDNREHIHVQKDQFTSFNNTEHHSTLAKRVQQVEIQQCLTMSHRGYIH